MCDAAERLWSKVAPMPDGCWEFCGTPSARYGHLAVGGATVGAHRLAWMLAYGPIPAGLVVRHACDNSRCVRLTHLSLGTPEDNVADKVARGRQARGERNGAATIADRDARAIRDLYAGGSVTQAFLAEWFGVSQQSVSSIVNGHRWVV